MFPFGDDHWDFQTKACNTFSRKVFGLSPTAGEISKNSQKELRRKEDGALQEAFRRYSAISYCQLEAWKVEFDFKIAISPTITNRRFKGNQN